MTNRETRRAVRAVAKRPPARTVTVSVTDGDFAGWEATARADFPAGLLVDLESGSIAKVIDVLEVILVEHNFPNQKDGLAAKLADVDPYDGLMTVAGLLLEAIGRLPPR